MNVRNDEGQMLVMVALSLAVLMGFVALAVDVGVLFRARRNMQIAADSAAMAAATQLYFGPAAQYNNAALAAAKVNGVDTADAGSVVLVDAPPADGPNTGCGTCVEVRVASYAPTFFASLFTGGNKMTVSARAVAGAPSASNACIWIMDPSAQNALTLQGNTTIDAPGCSIYVNSDNNNAVKVIGNSSEYNGPEFDVVGGYTGHNTQGTGITSGVAPETPPINNVGDPSSCTSDSSTTTISGAYTPSGGATAVCFSKAVTLQNGAQLAGALGNGIVYVFQKGLTIATGATVSSGSYTGDPTVQPYDSGKTYGAVLDISGGTFSQASNSVLNAFAPTSGSYNAIAIMQPASNPATSIQVQFGSNNQVLDGIIYAPGAQVYLQDNGGGVTASGVISKTMDIKSSTLSIPNYSNVNPTTTPFRVLTMLE